MSAVVEHSPLPSRHAVRNTVEDLIGRDLDLSDGVPMVPKSTNLVAVYVTDKLATSALVLLDLEGAARLGGALGMVPRLVVDEAIAARGLTETLEANCTEVLNVLGGVFNQPAAPHVRLYQTYASNAGLPHDVAALSASMTSRMDVVLKISGYGNGLLSIVVR